MTRGLLRSPGQDRLLGVAEAAALLGLKRSTMYQWAYERRIPTVKLGRALRFRLSAIERLIADAERPARPGDAGRGLAER